jgi:transcriptional regulator with XRE-family HTH domain
MAEYLADVGSRMRQARLRNRPELSSHEKAARELEKFGVTVTAKQYARWERGESEPRGNKKTHIAEMLGVTRDEIWGQPPIAPEEELRAQLDRIEANQREILAEIAVTRDERAAAEARIATQLRSIVRRLGTAATGNRNRATG